MTASDVGWTETFDLPQGTDTVVGEIHFVQVRRDETLVDIAREFDLGYDQIVRTNPGVNRWIPDEGTKVVIAHQYVLPGSVRRGIILNIAELRLYYYPSPARGATPQVITHPVSIGRMDWRTPLGRTSVVKKERDPAWRPPPSIRREHELDGEVLPEVIAGGAPDNPLGRFALGLGFPSYLIHGVDERKAYGIGMRVTHGCIRMYPEDIETLFSEVSVGTPVLIVNEPIKIGRIGERVFLEVHQPLEENEDEVAPIVPRVSSQEALQFVRQRVGPLSPLEEERILDVTERGDGIPVEIVQVAGPLNSHATFAQRSPSQAPIGTKTRKTSLDEEYERAVSSYLRGEEAQLPSATPTVSRELPRRRDNVHDPEAEVSEVQKYLEERY